MLLLAQADIRIRTARNTDL